MLITNLYCYTFIYKNDDSQKFTKFVQDDDENDEKIGECARFPNIQTKKWLVNQNLGEWSGIFLLLFFDCITYYYYYYIGGVMVMI